MRECKLNGKRIKRLKKGAESIKEEIEKHFTKLEKEINEKKEILSRYHIKEIDKSLLDFLEKKLSLLKADKNILQQYKKRLENLKAKSDSQFP